MRDVLGTQTAIIFHLNQFSEGKSSTALPVGTIGKSVMAWATEDPSLVSTSSRMVPQGFRVYR